MADQKQRRVNILLPNFGLRPVGGFKIAYIYANHLAANGYRVTVIHEVCSDFQKKPEHIVQYARDLLKLASGEKNWFRFHKAVHCRYVFDLNRRTIPDADVTIATMWKTAVVLDTLRHAGKKVYLIQHYETWSGRKQDVDETWHYDMEKIVISKWLLDIGRKMNCSRMTYIPNAINCHKFRVYRDIEDRDCTVSMLYSHDSNFKDSRTGLAVLKKVREQIPGLKVKLFGVDRRTGSIPKWMEYYENPKQEVLVKEIYNRSSVFLCTSTCEGWGLPPMEAMACGCAVVTTDNGGIRDFAMDGQTALVRNVKDTEALAGAVIKLLSGPDQRIRMAYAGMRCVRKFTWKKSFDQFDEVIDGGIS